MSLEEARNQMAQQAKVEEAQNQIPLSQLQATLERSKSAESVPPLAVVDPKGGPGGFLEQSKENEAR